METRTVDPTLDEQGRWQERVDYYIGMGKKDPCDWSAVMRALGKWLVQP